MGRAPSMFYKCSYSLTRCLSVAPLLACLVVANSTVSPTSTTADVVPIVSDCIAHNISISGFGRGSANVNRIVVTMSVVGSIGFVMGVLCLHNMWRLWRRCTLGCCRHVNEAGDGGKTTRIHLYDERYTGWNSVYKLWRNNAPDRDRLLAPYFLVTLLSTSSLIAPVWYTDDQFHDRLAIPWGGLCVFRAIYHGSKYGIRFYEVAILLMAMPRHRAPFFIRCLKPQIGGRFSVSSEMYWHFFVMVIVTPVSCLAYLGLCLKNWSGYLESVNWCLSYYAIAPSAYQTDYINASRYFNELENINLRIKIGILCIALVLAGYVSSVHMRMSKQSCTGLRDMCTWFTIPDIANTAEEKWKDSMEQLQYYIIVYVLFIVPALVVSIEDPEKSIDGKGDHWVIYIELIRSFRAIAIFSVYMLSPHNPSAAFNHSGNKERRVITKVWHRFKNLFGCGYRHETDTDTNPQLDALMQPLV